jgi:hypothetical protein
MRSFDRRTKQAPRVTVTTRMELLEARALPATFTWSGASRLSGNRSDLANWVGGVAPTPGPSANLMFPALASGGHTISVDDLPAGSAFGSITFTGEGYALEATPGGFNSLSVSAINDLASGGTGGNFATNFLANNLTLLLSGVTVQITYHGGAGNDVVITRTA